MEKIKRKAYGKINLSLDVIGKRDNGYHEVEMVMQRVSLHDTVTIKKVASGITLNSNNKELPLNEGNIAYQAATLMIAHFHLVEGVEITIDKNIPVAAGMAGGSTDAAAVLLGMNELFALQASEETLAKLALTLGADVPFCLGEKTALAQGIGEILTPLTPLCDCSILISKPNFGVSTKWVYESFDATTKIKHPDTKSLIEAINKEDLQKIAEQMENVLEAVTAKKYPEITELKKLMKAKGALGSMMTGSGPTVFGLFAKEEEASQAKNMIAGKFPENANFIVKPL